MVAALCVRASGECGGSEVVGLGVPTLELCIPDFVEHTAFGLHVPVFSPFSVLDFETHAASYLCVPTSETHTDDDFCVPAVEVIEVSVDTHIHAFETHSTADLGLSVSEVTR